MIATGPRTLGRPSATDHAAIDRAAFDLFEQQGFEATTMDQIAQAVGVGKRTLFRYFPSKNDIPWGQFDVHLQHFREQLDAQPRDIGIAEAVHRCVVAFNDFDPDTLARHRVRMQLILMTPTLQAHSAIKYAAWRQVIADYVADRTGTTADDLRPTLVGHVSLALAVTSYERWLARPELQLTAVLEESMTALADHVASLGPSPSA